MIASIVRGQVWLLLLLVGAIVWSFMLVLPHAKGRAGPADNFEYQLLDMRYRLTGAINPSPDVVIVAIDDATLASETLQESNTRQRLAQLIDAIAQSGARTVAVDVLLANATVAEDDTALAEALGRLPAMIAAAARFDAENEPDITLIWPYASFMESAQAGLVNLSSDAGGTPRYVPLLVEVDGQLIPSLPLLAALGASGENASFGEAGLTLGERVIPLDAGLNLPLRYTGPGGSIPTVSATELADGPRPDLLSDKIVVLGFSAAAMGDRFATPFDDDMPGMEIIATAVSQLTGGDTLTRNTGIRQLDALHAVLLALLSVLAVWLWPLTRGIAVVVVLLGLSMLVVSFAFASGLWLSAALPLMAAVPPAFVAGGLRYRKERQEASQSEKTVESLRRFQSPALARRIEEDPDYLAVPQEQTLVIFFVDLTGFTGLSQRLGTDGTRLLLKEFHRLVGEAVEAQGGSVFNYMGDGVMAVFGLTIPPKNGASDAALKAAFRLVKALAAQRVAEHPEERLRCRIGLHFGPVTLSRLGAASHQQVTVTGDTVNLSSRLMEVAKSHSATIVASGTLAATLLDADVLRSAQRTEVSVRGRSGQVPIAFWTQSVVLGLPE